MVKIEKYFGFGVPDCEAVGGLNDLLCRSDSLEDVIECLKKHKNGLNYVDDYWINDMTTFKCLDIEI